MARFTTSRRVRRLRYLRKRLRKRLRRRSTRSRSIRLVSCTSLLVRLRMRNTFVYLIILRVARSLLASSIITISVPVGLDQ